MIGLIALFVAQLSLVLFSFCGPWLWPKTFQQFLENGIDHGILMMLSVTALANVQLRLFLVPHIWIIQIVQELIVGALAGLMYSRLDHLIWCCTVHFGAAWLSLYRVYSAEASGTTFFLMVSNMSF